MTGAERQEQREQLTRLVQKWKKRLRLDNWHIQSDYVRHADLPTQNARVTYDVRRRRAFITVVWEEDRSDDPLDQESDEYLVVHELLHLHLAPLAYDSGTVEDLAIEQGIHSVAEALMNLAYQERWWVSGWGRSDE